MQVSLPLMQNAVIRLNEALVPRTCGPRPEANSFSLKPFKIDPQSLKNLKSLKKQVFRNFLGPSVSADPALLKDFIKRFLPCSYAVFDHMHHNRGSYLVAHVHRQAGDDHGGVADHAVADLPSAIQD